MTIMTMNADDGQYDPSDPVEIESCEKKFDCQRAGKDYTSCISNAVNNVLEGIFLSISSLTSYLFIVTSSHTHRNRHRILILM